MSMSIGPSSSLNPALAVMLSQLTPASTATPGAGPSGSSTAPAIGVGTGSGKAPVSDDILNLFSQMHQAAGSAHHAGGASGGSAAGASSSTSTISTASTMMSPLDQLMAAIGMADDTEDDVSSAQTQYIDPNTLLPDQAGN